MSFDKILVIGSGSWATALVKILQENKDLHVDWWVRSEETASAISSSGTNPKYLKSVQLDTNRLTLSTDIKSLVAENALMLLVTPSAFIGDAFSGLTNDDFAGKKIISAIKGVEPKSLQIIGEFLFNNLGVEENNFGVITGPCHAEEVEQEKLSYLTFASTNSNFCSELTEALSCDYIRTTASADIYGTEISAVLKNVYAIAAGMYFRLGYGDNFLAVLVSNAIREIKRFIAAVHPINRDIDDSAYLGDLLVTAYSKYSRNRRLGDLLGHGKPIEQALSEMKMIAEGYYATESIHKLNEKYNVDMPILNCVYNVIYKQAEVSNEAFELTKKLN